MVHLVVVTARFATAGSAEDLASAFMADDRTATVWIHADNRTSRLAFDIGAESWEEAARGAEELVVHIAEQTGATADIVSVGRPASPDRLRETT